MQLKNWEDYSEKEKKDILIYWFYENINKYDIDIVIKKQFFELIDNCPDFVYDYILLSIKLYNDGLLILHEAIKQKKLAFLCKEMDTKYIYMEEVRKSLEKEFLSKIINSFEENVVIPNNQTYITVTVSKPDTLKKSLNFD